MTVLIAALIWLAGIVIWELAGDWEWSPPQRWQEKLARWGEGKSRASQTLSIYWHIEDEPEIERRYIEIRQLISKLEKELGLILWIEFIICFKEYTGRIRCYERRFRDIQLRFQKDSEEQGQ